MAEIDGLKLAFESVARDSLEPSLPAGTVAFKSIVVGREGQAVLVARIAQSWLAPHRIGRQGNRDFWTRTNAGKEPMTIAQLRDAFVLSGTVREKIREFVYERVNDLAGNAGGPPDAPIDLHRHAHYDSPAFVLHVLPVAALARHDIHIGVVRISENRVANWRRSQPEARIRPQFERRSHCSARNLQLADSRSSIAKGCWKHFNPSQHDGSGGMPPEREMYVGYFERDLREALSRYLSLLADESIGAPICLYLTLLHASNCRLEYTQEWYFRSPRMVGSNIAVLPEVLIHDTSAAEVDKQLKVLFDSLWNCGDTPADPSFDENGTWCGPKS